MISDPGRRVGPAGTRTFETLAFAYLLLAPLLVSGPNRGGSGELELGPPRIHSGDEPHYLIQINSLLNDGDLDLANNYASVHRGGIDAGRNFARAALDLHVNWYVEGRNVYWIDVFEVDPRRWTTNESGNPEPTLRGDAVVTVPEGPQYSWHPPGLALLLAVPLYPLRGTGWVESGALLCSGLAVLGSLLFFRCLVDPWLADRTDFWLVAAVTYLGTPVWHYGRTLFTEPYLLFCTVGAYALHLRGGKHLSAGILIGIGVLLKPSFAILALPLAGDLLLRRRWRSLGLFCLPCAGAVALVAALNTEMYGAWYRSGMRYSSVHPLGGAFGSLFSTEHGLLPFAPAAIAVAAAWPGIFQVRRREAVILLSAVGLQLAFLAPYAFWHGGFCYGPRYLVPVLPLLFAATPVPRGGAVGAGQAASRRTVLVLYALSILLNFVGAFSGRDRCTAR